jgi:hypothetical protein
MAWPDFDLDALLVSTKARVLVNESLVSITVV